MKKIEVENEDKPLLNYVIYEDLQQLTQQEIANDSITNLINNLVEQNNQKWMNNFNALIFLRRINKFNKPILQQVIPKITSLINKLSVSLRSGITFECSIFLGELFKYYEIKTPEDLTNIVPYLPIAFHTLFTPKAFLKEQARKTIIDSMGNNNTFNSLQFISNLIDEMKDNKPIVSDTAYELYELLFKKTNNLSSAKNEDWKAFFEKINALYDKKREIYVKKAIEILKQLETKLTIDKLKNILKNCGMEEWGSKYENWMKLREKSNTNNMSLKDFKKQRKKKQKVKKETNAKKEEDVVMKP